ncbi:MAG: MBL fold metallo-hydrolase [Gemmatimonadota bacterium]|nr:MBL fold metallo-hydrolase [Gemmatimonadota bacterium]
MKFLPLIVLSTLIAAGTVLVSACSEAETAKGKSPAETAKDKPQAETAKEKSPAALKLSVVFNNEPFDERLETSWGFGCYIEGLGQTILFDTGGDGEILLSNMKTMGLDSRKVNLVVLSHYHGDHINGLESFLRENHRVTVCMPQSFPDSFQMKAKKIGALVLPVTEPAMLLDRAYSTGEMGPAIIEQSLIIDTPKGLVVVNGCSHPGVVNIVRRAKEMFRGREILFVIGGFHLGSTPEAEVREIISQLKYMGVRRIAATHCTGDDAIAMFREAWGDNYVEGGVGAVIEFDL